MAKCVKFNFSWGCTLDPAWESQCSLRFPSRIGAGGYVMLVAVPEWKQNIITCSIQVCCVMNFHHISQSHHHHHLHHHHCRHCFVRCSFISSCLLLTSSLHHRRRRQYPPHCWPEPATTLRSDYEISASESSHTDTPAAIALHIRQIQHISPSSIIWPKGGDALCQINRGKSMAGYHWVYDLSPAANWVLR